MGSPAWGLDFTLLRGNPKATEISLQKFRDCIWENSHPSCKSYSLPTSLVVKWFLLSVLGYKASLQLVFSWLFWIITLI